MAGAELTSALGLIIGAYILVASAGLLRGRAADAFFDDLAAHSGAAHATGAVAFLAGTAILAFHWRWATFSEVAVSAVAAFWVFEGAGLLFSPEKVQAVMATARFRKARRIFDILSLPLGIYLLAVSLR